jgi:hypothetical protein
MSKPVVAIFDAVAVSGTTTYKSAVTRAPLGTPPPEYGVTFEFTSTATGTLKLEVNNRSHQDYSNDVGAGTEAANTTGWVQRDLSPTATIAVTAALTGTIAVKGRFARWRLSYTNATNSGVLTARVAMP